MHPAIIHLKNLSLEDYIVSLLQKPVNAAAIIIITGKVPIQGQ